MKADDAKRLMEAVERARAAARGRSDGAGEAGRREAARAPARTGVFASRFVIRSTGRMVLVRAEDVDWIEAAGNYARLRIGAEGHLLRETMNSLEKRLDPARFVRIHRSTIVNLDRVKELRHLVHGDYAVLLRDGTRLVLSRGYRRRFERRVLGAARDLASG